MKKLLILIAVVFICSSCDYLKRKGEQVLKVTGFSVSKRDISKVCNYIENQKEHHSNQCYAEEYDTFYEFIHAQKKKRLNKLAVN